MVTSCNLVFPASPRVEMIQGSISRMSEEKQNAPKSLEETRHSTKKPYKKPEFRHEQVFETMALACGKVGITQPSCRFNKKNS